MRRLAIAGLVVAFCGPACAQTSPQLPAMGGIGGAVQFGNQPAPPAGQANNDGPGFGHDTAAPPPLPAQPARQNYADELTDFPRAPAGHPQNRRRHRNPALHPRRPRHHDRPRAEDAGHAGAAHRRAEGPPHPTLPGAELWPGAGDGGSFNDTIQTEMWQALSAATHKTRTYPIVFLCEGSRCWESYNAALRAAKMGFTQVMWYRGGLEAWHAAGLPMTGAGQQPAPQPPKPNNGPGFDAP